MTNKELDEIIRENKEPALSEAFYSLANKVLDYLGDRTSLIGDRDYLLQEGVMFCYEKLKRYDSSKGVAVNFFTTILSGFYRQTTRTKESYQELKKRYYESRKNEF